MRRLLLALALIGLASNVGASSTRSQRVFDSMFVRVGGVGFPAYASDPYTCESVTERAMYYNTASKTVQYCNGTVWTTSLTYSGAFSVTGPITGQPGSGANQAGSDLTIIGGASTGTGIGGDLWFQTTNEGAAGSTVNAAKTRAGILSKTFTMADAGTVSLITVALPNADTWCSIVLAYSYGATDGADTISHMGILNGAFTNDDTVVTGTIGQPGETVNGTGCDDLCDTFAVAVVGANATITGTFNSAAMTGYLRLNLLSASGDCAISVN